ncbi:uncharacterized protein YALI1_C19909g [Yarrowia lipolytica]|uniref:Uncharacterized protein n=1 Tax=Yarrowia lipolytica TaxID=4952 RepID=A0A1D8NB49_YARLL|nr:hypothetical protein YALI1_C19909g [Yarrowia lipolytica]
MRVSLLSLNVLIMTPSCYIDCTGPVPRLPSSVQCLTSNITDNSPSCNHCLLLLATHSCTEQCNGQC